MKVLITGGAGYIGTELCKSLLQEDSVDSILVYDNLSRKNYNIFQGIKFMNPEKLSFIQADILDTRNLKKAVSQVDTVVHLAAMVSTPFADNAPHQLEQINHWGTAELSYAVEASNINQLIYLSSASAYGSHAEMIEEDSIPNPRNFYGISKLKGEGHIRRLNNKLDSNYIIRAANVFGYSPCARYDALLNKFLFEANYHGRITIHGDGHQWRTFIHIERLISYLKALLLKDIPSGIYNLTDYNLKVIDVAESLRKLYPEMEMLFVSQNLRLREIRLNPDSTLKSLIPLEGLPFEKGLADFKKSFSF